MEELAKLQRNCRLCLQENTSFRCLPDPEILDLIAQAIPGLELSMDSNLSKLLCDSCYQQIIGFSRLKQVAYDNQSYLKALLASSISEDAEIKIEPCDMAEDVKVFVEPMKAESPDDLDFPGFEESAIDEPEEEVPMRSVGRRRPRVVIEPLKLREAEEMSESASKKRKYEKLGKTGKPMAPQYKEKNGVYYCPICGNGFSDHWNCQRHGDLTHAEFDWHFRGRTWKCQFCDLEFRTRRILLSHEEGHRQNETVREVEDPSVVGKTGKPKAPPYIPLEDGRAKCPICFMVFKSKSNMQQHAKQYHEEFDWYFRRPKESRLCRFCGRTFQKLQMRRDHERIHENQDPYTCDICGMQTMYKDKIRTHLQKHLALEGSWRSDFRCKTCGHPSLTEKEFFRHQRTHLTPVDKPKYTCHECLEQFAWMRHLREHMKERHSKYKCDLCLLAVFNTISGFNAHMRRHEPPSQRILKTQPFPCPACELRFSSQEILERHQKNHELHRLVCCDICGRTVTKEMMRKHYKLHTGEKNHMCEHCGKKFVSKCDVVKHMKVHENPEQFECGRCGFSHHKKHVYSIHVKKCDGIRPGTVFKCVRCPAVFKKKTERERHVRIVHTGFNCVQCNFVASGNNSLRLHYKSEEHKMAMRLKRDAKAQRLERERAKREGFKVESLEEYYMV